MPLSEDEQRILNQIEQQFYESDPAFAQQVSQTTLYRHAFGRVKWGILGLIVGLGLPHRHPAGQRAAVARSASGSCWSQPS